MAKNIDDWFIWVEANRDTPTRKWTEEVLPPAKAALYSDILELIGEDEPFSLEREKEWSEFDMEARSVESENQLRATQRQALKEYFNL